MKLNSDEELKAFRDWLNKQEHHVLVGALIEQSWQHRESPLDTKSPLILNQFRGENIDLYKESVPVQMYVQFRADKGNIVRHMFEELTGLLSAVVNYSAATVDVADKIETWAKDARIGQMFHYYDENGAILGWIVICELNG